MAGCSLEGRGINKNGVLDALSNGVPHVKRKVCPIHCYNITKDNR